jgi:hypothetical protein
MSKHTPGPWKLDRDELHYGSLSTVVAGKKSKRFPGYQMFVDVGGLADVNEQEANARLIASAPELLEALKDLLRDIDTIDEFAINNTVLPMWEDIERAKALVAKAEGRL